MSMSSNKPALRFARRAGVVAVALVAMAGLSQVSGAHASTVRSSSTQSGLLPPGFEVSTASEN